MYETATCHEDVHAGRRMMVLPYQVERYLRYLLSYLMRQGPPAHFLHLQVVGGDQDHVQKPTTAKP